MEALDEHEPNVRKLGTRKNLLARHGSAQRRQQTVGDERTEYGILCLWFANLFTPRYELGQKTKDSAVAT